jgi:hypothetical protein
MNLKNITLIAVTVSCLLQAGAQLFAVSMVASTLAAAPPRSLFILQGEYGYNSSSFWEIVPTLTFGLFIVALIANWKTQRKKFVLAAMVLFVIAGLLAGFVLEPIFADIMKVGYSDHIDAALQAQARTWYLLDWMVWALGFVSGLILLLTLTKSPNITPSKDFNS